MTEETNTEAAEIADPVLARFLVGATIRQLVQRDGRGPNALAKAAGVSIATWKRWVAGTIKEWGSPQVYALMAALGYGHKDPATLDLLQLATDARRHNVTSRPEWVRSRAFDLLMAVEGVSERIRTYELTVIPGLLQTEAYARAHLALAGIAGDLEERVQLRMTRQAILRSDRTPAPVRYSAILDEALLHRPPADPAVMRGQLAHLLDLTEQRHISLRVIPFAAGPYPTDGNGPFLLLESARVGGDIVHLETSRHSTYLETSEATAPYLGAWERLAARAEDEEESAKRIRRLQSAAPR